jgi:hypothetical protein
METTQKLNYFKKQIVDQEEKYLARKIELETMYNKKIERAQKDFFLKVTQYNESKVEKLEEAMLQREGKIRYFQIQMDVCNKREALRTSGTPLPAPPPPAESS